MRQAAIPEMASASPGNQSADQENFAQQPHGIPQRLKLA